MLLLFWDLPFSALASIFPVNEDKIWRIGHRRMIKQIRV